MTEKRHESAINKEASSLFHPFSSRANLKETNSDSNLSIVCKNIIQKIIQTKFCLTEDKNWCKIWFWSFNNTISNSNQYSWHHQQSSETWEFGNGKIGWNIDEQIRAEANMRSLDHWKWYFPTITKNLETITKNLETITKNWETFGASKSDVIHQNFKHESK